MKSRRLRKTREDPVAKLARAILPDGQLIVGQFEFHDVSHFTESDQRQTLRSGERRTLRRKPKLDTGPILKLLDTRELAACHWYKNAHALRYDTTNITAAYGTTCRGNEMLYGHWPNSQEALKALFLFDEARAGINRFLVALFEGVVLHDRPLGRLRLSFKLAARQLLETIEDRVAL